MDDGREKKEKQERPWLATGFARAAAVHTPLYHYGHRWRSGLMADYGLDDCRFPLQAEEGKFPKEPTGDYGLTADLHFRTRDTKKFRGATLRFTIGKDCRLPF